MPSFTSSWLGIKNLGFVEDNPSRWTDDLNILGTSADLPALIDRYKIEHVFICLPMAAITKPGAFSTFFRKPSSRSG